MFSRAFVLSGFMRKIVLSIKRKPVNLWLITIVSCLYFLNEFYLKEHTSGLIQSFFVCYFNDLICPLAFIAYSNLILITANREIHKFGWLLLFGLCAGMVWEFVAPLIKASSVTDIMDLACYVSGTLLYWCIMRVFRRE